MALHQNIILVCHGRDRDLRILGQIDIDLHPLCIIDTVKAAQYPLQLSYRYSLEKLLDEFNIPFCNLHTAGNDAHFILRALLMVTVRDAELESDLPVLPSWLPILRTIAHAPCTKLEHPVYQSPSQVLYSSQPDVPILTEENIAKEFLSCEETLAGTW